MKKKVSEKLFENTLLANISRISEAAISLAQQSQSSYVVMEGRDIVEIFPDGSKVILQTVEKRSRLKTGKLFKIQ
jgi:hypothetical protein